MSSIRKSFEVAPDTDFRDTIMQIYEFSKDTMVILPLSTEEKFVFTVEEALNYIIKNDRYRYLQNLVFRNVPIRDAIRSNGLRAVTDKLLEYVPNDTKLKTGFENLVIKFGDERLADFDIQVLPIDAKLKLFGMRLDYAELVNHIEIAKRVCGGFSDIDSNATLHVAAIYDRYPCFDSYDYANETRCYVNLFVGNHMMAKDDCLEIEKSPRISNCCFVHDGMDTKCLPAVYYEGEGNFMYVATSKDNPQITPEELVVRK